MKNRIGGLFETQEDANRAYEALQSSGFPEEKIHMFVHKPRNRTARSMEVSLQEIAKYAFLGAMIVGIFGGFLGFLVGIGTIPLPYLEPGSAPRDSLFVFTSVAWGLITGGLTGAILGAASRLLRSREKAEVMTRQIDKQGVLVMVDLEHAQDQARVRRVMEEHKAIETGKPNEKWDLASWMSPNEKSPSLVNPR